MASASDMMNVEVQEKQGNASMLTPAACHWLDEQWSLNATRVDLSDHQHSVSESALANNKLM